VLCLFDLRLIVHLFGQAFPAGSAGRRRHRRALVKDRPRPCAAVAALGNAENQRHAAFKTCLTCCSHMTSTLRGAGFGVLTILVAQLPSGFKSCFTQWPKRVQQRAKCRLAVAKSLSALAGRASASGAQSALLQWAGIYGKNISTESSN